MKIQTSIRALYYKQFELCEKLQNKVDPLIRGLIPNVWHYESRIKSEESFALKIESGRFDRPHELEDFFGCFLVVRNATEVPLAERIVCENFEIKYRRPPNDRILQKGPENFRYDGIRLYVRMKRDPAMKPSPLEHVIFEIQIKTYLMHAWDISTHDIVYKTSTPNWGTSRVAYQIKAMLEHADLSIMEAEHLAQNSTMDITTKEFESLGKVVEFLQRTWERVDLPGDLRRLSENVLFLLTVFGIDINQLESIIKFETGNGRGTKIRNLSPYGVILKSVINKEPNLIKRAVASMGEKKLLITPELEFTDYKSGNVILV